jgi:hypothetical protein
MDRTAGKYDRIDLTALSGLGMHTISDPRQAIVGGSDLDHVKPYTGTNSITVNGFHSSSTASRFHFG